MSNLYTYPYVDGGLPLSRPPANGARGLVGREESQSEDLGPTRPYSGVPPMYPETLSYTHTDSDSNSRDRKSVV